MTVGEVIAWLIFGGIIGGVADLCFHLRYEKDGFAYKPPTGELGSVVLLGFWGFFGLFVLSAFIGLSGAIGVQIVFILIGKFSGISTVENSLLLFSMSVVAGFGARRLLPKIRDRLEEEILKTKEESREAVEEAQEATEGVKEARAQLKLLESLRPHAPASERAYCIKYLFKALENNPTDRTNAIILGRLQRASGDLGSGVDTLSRFLEVKGNVHDKDYADALYNRACYNSLRWEQDARQEFLTAALDDLALSIKLSPENKEDAEQDDDFNPIRDHTDFAQLIHEN